MQQLEASSGKAMKIHPNAPRQLALFPDTNPLVDELKAIDLNSITPIEAITRLYEWQRRFVDKKPPDHEGS